MKKLTTLLPLVAGVLVTLLAIGGLGATTGSQTFNGSYDWANGGSDELSAEFVPDGDGMWKVVFRFRFSGKDKSWKGTAAGSLDNGSDLTGTASWGRRNWTWTASITDGVMQGQHTELQGDDEIETGTFEVSR